MPAPSFPLRGVEALGRRTRTFLSGDGRRLARVRFIGAVARSAFGIPAAARPLVLRTILNQVRFTAVHALWIVAQVALVIGVTVVVQAHAQASRFGFSDVLGQVVFTVVVRELGPLLAAIVVLGRSGTAIAAELATNGVMGETEAMEAAGVDPLQYLVLPRVIGGAVSLMLLAVYFDALTLASGALGTAVLGQVPVDAYAASVRLALTPTDLVVTTLKGALFGAGIALLCAYEGLTGGRRPTDVPQSVTRGVVSSLLFLFASSALVSWLLYA